MNSMVMQPQTSNTTPMIDSATSCHLTRNDGIQPSNDEKTRLEEDPSIPPCFTADPLLLPSFQEVSKQQYYQYAEQKKRKKGGSDDEDDLVLFEPHTIAPSPTPFDAVLSRELQRWGGPTHTPLYQQAPLLLDDLMELQDEPVTVKALSWQHYDLSQHRQKQEESILLPESYCSPPLHRQVRDSSTILRSSSTKKTDGSPPSNKGCSSKMSIQAAPGTRRKAASSKSRALPEHFAPRRWSVIVGRDKASLQAPGNKQLHTIVRLHLERYSKCSNNKVEKTRIISEIESIIRRNYVKSCEGECQDVAQEGPFVKFEDGRWWEVNPWIAREKIGRMLRESLHTKYSSSSRRKRARRRLLEQKAVVDMEKVDSVSSTPGDNREVTVMLT